MNAGQATLVIEFSPLAVDVDGLNTYNSWMILSKLTTAKRREATAAPAIRDSVTIRMSDAAFFTVDGDRLGIEYATVAMFQRCRILPRCW